MAEGHARLPRQSSRKEDDGRSSYIGSLEGRRRQRIGALQIQGVLREMGGGNPLPPQRPGCDLRFI